MVVEKRVRRGADITAKGLDRMLKRGLSPRQRTAVLKRAVFSNDRDLRKDVAEDLLKKGEFKFLLNMAKKAKRKHFSDRAFFSGYMYGELPLEVSWVTKEVIARLKAGLAKGPVSKFRGFAVYEMERLPPEAMLYWGRIVIDKNYSKSLKPVACAHEVGEIFHHMIGIGMELLEVKKQKVEKEYLKNMEMGGIERIRDVSNVAEIMPEMKRIAKELMKLRMRYGSSGP